MSVVKDVCVLLQRFLRRMYVSSSKAWSLTYCVLEIFCLYNWMRIGYPNKSNSVVWKTKTPTE